jgi:hypothetical protein
VLEPDIVIVGMTLPFAPAAKTVIEFVAKLATCKALLASSVRLTGWLRPVIAPVMFLIGEAFPCALFV